MNLDAFKEFLNTHDRFAASNGMRVVEVSPGYAVAEFTVAEKHLNGVNIVQGGALFTLADLAFAAAVNAHGQITVALNVNITFVHPAFTGDILTAEARENHLSHRIGSYTVEVRNQKKELLALFQGTGYRKEKPIPF